MIDLALRSGSLLTDPKLQALRDCYLIHAATGQESYSENPDELPTTIIYDSSSIKGKRQQSIKSVFIGFLRQYRDLSTNDRLRRALIAAGVVNLSQQLCGM